ncbi:MAG TPA: 50S ribosomal protein L11 methyltransferase [Pyrinomonadaceae bacterium]|jgi:ribosomal protein L11 methyltransferase|nr:50S ribosomal protein L11 methyltransferase [Pyrinomonadaceae bacterium]
MSEASIQARRTWFALNIVLEDGATEAVEYALMEAGALGTENLNADEGMTRVVAYFEAPPAIETIRSALFDALRVYDLPSQSVRRMELDEVADKDWLGEWKKSWQPVSVGKRFIIAPPWSEVLADPQRFVIRIEPGMAFGTGTHETTRLCLSAIEKHFQGGSFLDVGTGTGILSIAAALLFPESHIEACDTDVDAIEIARENARLNNVSEQIVFHVGTVTGGTPSAEMVCANLTADVIAPLLPALVGATCGRLILSGILDSQVSMIESRLQELGINEPHEIATDGEWVAIII